MALIKLYLLNILIALDHVLNAFFAGDPSETLSSRAGKSMKKGMRWACILCKLLDYIDKDHCLKYIQVDRGHFGIDTD